MDDVLSRVTMRHRTTTSMDCDLLNSCFLYQLLSKKDKCNQGEVVKGNVGENAFVLSNLPILTSSGVYRGRYQMCKVIKQMKLCNTFDKIVNSFLRRVHIFSSDKRKADSRRCGICLISGIMGAITSKRLYF